jgi:predicted Zn-dependent protease
LLGRYEDALREAKDAVRLEPGAETSHEALAGITLALNRLDEAQTALKEWQALKPDSVIPVVNQYQLAFLQSDPAGMEKQLARAAGTKPLEGMLLSMQSDTEAYYGRLRKAREFTRRAAEAEGSDEETASARCANFKLGSAFREAEFGYPQQARRDVTAALTLSSGPSIQARAALVLALTADTGRAETIAAELARRYPLDTVGNRYWFPTIRAAIQLSRNNPAQAVQDLEATLRYELGGGWEQAYVRGQAFLVMHRGREAAAEFQKYIDHPGAVMNNPLGALARAGLARAYVLQGDTAKAKTTYQDFLTLWKDADPDIPVLKQAKAEYAKLQ